MTNNKKEPQRSDKHALKDSIDAVIDVCEFYLRQRIHQTEPGLCDGCVEQILHLARDADALLKFGCFDETADDDNETNTDN